MSEMKCPVTGLTGKGKEVNLVDKGTQNKDWWPNKLNLKILTLNNEKTTPMDKEFDYKKEFLSLNLEDVKKDIKALMTDSKEWWPADYGHYGPLFIRMAWHSAGTYRTGDGRGGANTGSQRFAPLNSWPDNANLDKARRLLWPVKQKYGNKLSWADLLILTGNCALEDMGFDTFGFGGGREDIFEPEDDTYWGKETKWLSENRYKDGRKLENPLAAVQMGLIYVNPEGPNGVPNALESAKDIRETFNRMGMNDEETVALIAGGHTFGKCHGAGDAKLVGPEPEAAPIENMGFGWMSNYKTGKGADTISSGIEGAWTPNPIQWDMGYLETLYKYDWNLVKSPAGAFQWEPTDPKAKETVPGAFDASKTYAPMMTTADLALRMDPEYAKISKRFLENPDEFKDAFAKAWFKLTHRDMGPRSRYLGSEVPSEDFIWQDPLPKKDFESINVSDVEEIKNGLDKLGLSDSDMVWLAISSATTFRGTDFRGGANGARIRLEPQRSWEVNEPEKLATLLNKYEEFVNQYNASHERKLTVADLIVLAGNYGVERAAKLNGKNLSVAFLPGRLDATAEMTDVNSFAVLEPVVDPFRNYAKFEFSVPLEEMMVEKAALMRLTAAELTVLVGGLRVLGINFKGTKAGVFTDRPGVLTNDFFKNILDMDIVWEKHERSPVLFNGKDRATGNVRFVGTRMDLIFGSNSELRAITEIYAQDDGLEKFYGDFVKVWNKVMNADRFDV